MFAARHPLYKKFKGMKGEIIELEGGIGAGKTTLGKSLAAFLNSIGMDAKFFPEYTNSEFLDAYIGDMPKYAFAFQMFLLAKRIEIYREAERYAATGAVAIVDRSIIGDMTFAKMQKANGNFTEQDWVIYLSTMKQEIQKAPTTLVYLKCDVPTLLDRIKKRGIESEIKGYDSGYLHQLNEAYASSIAEAEDVTCLQMEWNEDAAIVDKLLTHDFIEGLLWRIINA